MRELCADARKGRLCIDDICRGGGETLCGFDLDDYLAVTDKYFLDEDENDEFPFDCGMGRDGQCSMAGSEDCDFECPLMSDIHRAAARAQSPTPPSPGVREGAD